MDKKGCDGKDCLNYPKYINDSLNIMLCEDCLNKSGLMQENFKYIK